MAEDDVLARSAAAWRAAGLTNSAQRSDRPVRARRRGDTLLGGTEASDAAGQTVSAQARAATNFSPYWYDENGNIAGTGPVPAGVRAFDAAGNPYVAPRTPDLYVESMRSEGKPVPRDSSYWNLRFDETPEEVAAAARPVPRDGERRAQNPLYSRAAVAWNNALRRELSQEEFDALNRQQQDAVRFNTALLQAYDADMADSPVGRRNTAALISQLDIGRERENEIMDKLGLGVGPVLRAGDLGATPTLTSSNDEARRRLVQSIASEIATWVERSRNNTQPASPDAYRFADPQAKLDYEEAFNFLLDPNLRSTMTWAQAAARLQSFGYDPDDFKSYVLDRVQLMPMTDGGASVDEIKSWFE